MVPNLRQLDRCGRDYPNMMDGLIIRTYNENETPPHLKDAPYSDRELRRFKAKMGPGCATTWLQRGGDDITRVITHEFGHRVDYVQDDRIGRWVLDVERVRPRGREPVIHPDIDGLSKSAKRGYFDHLRNHLDAQVIDDATRISIYAQTNIKEAFAEAFAARYHHPDRANLVSNATLDAYGRLARREFNIGYGSNRYGQDEYLSATGLSKRRVDIRNRRLAVSVYRQLGIRKLVKVAAMTTHGPPPCLFCMHRYPVQKTEDPREDNLRTCAAYPKGIPDRILNGGTHDTVQPDQVGTFVYQIKSHLK